MWLLYTGAVKWLIVINRIQNKSIVYVCVLCTFIMCIYINTHPCTYIFKNNCMFIYYINYININIYM